MGWCLKKREITFKLLVNEVCKKKKNRIFNAGKLVRKDCARLNVEQNPNGNFSIMKIFKFLTCCLSVFVPCLNIVPS